MVVMAFRIRFARRAHLTLRLRSAAILAQHLLQNRRERLQDFQGRCRGAIRDLRRPLAELRVGW